MYLQSYQQLVAGITARVLLVVKKVMDIISEKEPEELLNEREEECYSFFEGLEQPRCGEVQKLRRLRHPRVTAFAEATSLTS